MTDKIHISLVDNDPLLAESLRINKSYICQEVQAVDLQFLDGLNGEPVAEIEMDEFLLQVIVKVV